MSTCPVCKSEFRSPYPWKRYCSRTCSMRGWRFTNPEAAKASDRRHNIRRRGKRKKARKERSASPVRATIAARIAKLPDEQFFERLGSLLKQNGVAA